MSLNLGSKGIQRITSRLASIIKTTYMFRRSISTSTYKDNQDHLAKIAPYVRKQGKADCFFVSRDFLNALHGDLRTPQNTFGFWDLISNFYNGSLPEAMRLELYSARPKSEADWVNLYKEFGPFDVKARNMTATGETGFSNERGEPATSRFPSGFHVVTMHGLVDIDGKLCFLGNDPEGGGPKINRLEATIAKGLTSDQSPAEVNPDQQPTVNKIKDMTNLYPICDLVKNTKFTDPDDGIYYRPDKRSSDAVTAS